MYNPIYLIIVFSFWFTEISSKSFYLDPIGGSLSAMGTIDDPWSSLNEVIDANLISSSQYTNLPYNGNNALIEKNINGLVGQGDTLFLMEGLHGNIFLQNYVNNQSITIMALPGHTVKLEKVHLQACKNWIFENIQISSEPYGYYQNNKLFYIESHSWQGPSSHIEIRNCHIYSSVKPWDTAAEWIANASDGLYIRGDYCVAVNNSIYNVDMGLTCLGDHIIAHGNQIINFSGDGSRILGSHISFKYNLIKNCYDVDDNHDDGIQSFTTNGITVDSNEVVGNFILNTDDNTRPLNGPLQGIGCFDGFYNDWLIANNVIHVNHWHGISLYGARRCKIIHNTVIDPSPQITPGGSWIRINEHKDGSSSTDCIVANNVSNKLMVDGLITTNVILDSTIQYQDHFMDVSNYDFRLKEGSSLIDAAILDYTISNDIEQTPRDDKPDIGAFEFDRILSVVNQEKRDLIKIYPNPVSDKINLDGLDDANDITLFDINARQIAKGNLESINTILPSLQTGPYILKITYSNHREVYTKFFKL